MVLLGDAHTQAVDDPQLQRRLAAWERWIEITMIRTMSIEIMNMIATILITTIATATIIRATLVVIIIIIITRIAAWESR